MTSKSLDRKLVLFKSIDEGNIFGSSGNDDDNPGKGSNRVQRYKLGAVNVDESPDETQTECQVCSLPSVLCF